MPAGLKLPDRNFIELQFAIIVISTSGTLGRHIVMPTPLTIWWRAALVALMMFVIARTLGIDLRVKSRHHLILLLLSGLLLGGHWLTYFWSLDLSTVAIAMLTLYAHPAITTILEPLLLKVPFSKMDLVMGISVFIGIYILIPEMSLDNKYTLAILLGLVSAFLYSLRNISVRKLAQSYSSISLMFYQCLTIGFVMLPVFLSDASQAAVYQWEALLILGLVTTGIGHTLFVRAFRSFSAAAATLMGSMLPVYGIIWGYFILGEVPSQKTLIGGAIILAVVLIKARKKR